MMFNPPRLGNGSGTPGHGTRALFSAVLFIALGAFANAATVTWTGRGGTTAWGDASNWSSGTLPGRSDEVVIPPRAGPVELRSGNHSILRITASDGLLLRGGTLTLTTGESRVGGLVVDDGAGLIGRGTNVVLITSGPPTEWGGDVTAAGGARLQLGTVARLRGGAASWRADEVGSVIDAPAITELNLATSGYFDLEASRQGRINLPALTSVRGPLRVTASGGGTVDLSGIKGRWSSEGFTYQQSLRISNGGAIRLPGVTEYDRGIVDVDGADGLPLAVWVRFTRGTFTVRRMDLELSSLISFDDTDLSALEGARVRLPVLTQMRITAQAFRAQGQRSLIDASALRDLSMATASYFDVDAGSGGEVNLDGLSVARGAMRITATGGGRVGLRGLKGRWSSDGFTYRQSVTVNTGGTVDMPGITEVDRGAFDIDAVNSVPTAQLTAFTRGALVVRRVRSAFDALANIDDSDLTAREGAVISLPRVSEVRSAGLTWRVQDPGSRLELGKVNEITLTTGGYLDILASTDGVIDLSGVARPPGPVRITASSGGVVDLTGLRGRWTSEGFTYQQWIRVNNGGVVRIPGVTGFDRGILETDSSTSIATPSLTTLTRSSLTIRGAVGEFKSLTSVDDTDLTVLDGGVLRLDGVRQIRTAAATWRAQGPGSLIDASQVQELTILRTGYHDLQASTLGRVDLSGVSALDGPLRVTVSSAGVVDLSGARGRWSSFGFVYSQFLRASGEGRILIPGITGFDRGQIDIDGDGFVSTAQLTSVTRSTITLDNAVAGFGRLTEQTGTTFTLRNGGRAVFGVRPRIVTQPEGKSVPPGSDVELTVVAQGDGPLEYQWRKNGQNLRGERSARLFLEDVGVDDAGSYTVVVLNPAGAVESTPAEVRLDIPALPMTDAFAARGRITTPSGVGTADSESATSETGEPRHAGKRGGKSLWITWRAPGGGRATFSTRGSSFDTLLAVYTGDGLGTLKEVASDEDSGGFLSSELEFGAVEGVDYHIVVDGFGGTGGRVVLSWDLTLGALALPRLLAEPIGGTVLEGSQFTMSAAVDGSALSFQWLFKGAPVPGGTSANLVLNDVDAADAGVYAVRIGLPGGQVIQTPWVLVEVVSRPDEKPAQDKLDDLFATPAPAALQGPGASGFTSVFPGIPGSRDTGNSGAQQSPEDPIILGEIGGASLWLGFRANADGWMRLSTAGSQIPTVLGVFTNRSALEPIALAATTPPAQHCEVLFGAYAGEDYLVMIDGVDGATGGIRVSYSLDLEPVNAPKASFVNGSFLIQLPVTPGEYDVAVADDVTTFTPLLSTNVNGGMFQLLEAPAVGKTRRFYRIGPAP